MKRKSFRGYLAVLLALLMAFSLLPTAALADSNDADVENGITIDINVIAAVYEEGDWEVLHPKDTGTDTTVTVVSSDGDPTLIDAIYKIDPEARISGQNIDAFLGLPVESDPGTDRETEPEGAGWRCSVNDNRGNTTDYNRELESNDRILFSYHLESVDMPTWETLCALLTPESGSEPGDSGSVSPTPDPEIAVYFTLQGLGSSLGEETWIETEKVTIAKGATAYDVIIKVLQNQNYASTILWDNNYVESITTPGGFTLSEGHNDMPNSGWLYMVNSQMPEVGMASYNLTNGDHILLYFTKDYTLDPEAGVAPESEKTPVKENEPGTAVVEITAVVRDNAAVAVVDTRDIKDALDKIKNTAAGETREIKLAVATAPEASTYRVKLRSGDLKAIVDADNIQLTVESKIAAVTLDTKTLTGITEGVADNTTVRLTVTTVNASEIDAEKQAVIGTTPAVFDLRVTVGDDVIRHFGGTAAVFLPFTPDTETDANELTVHYLGEDLKRAPLKDARYDNERGGFVFTTTHFSLFFIAEATTAAADNEWTNPFTDVEETDWFFDVVKCININQLMAGTTADEFAPQLPMTRAMLVTVLHRHAGEPTAATTHQFDDVAAGVWYGPAVAWAAENNIISGYARDRFGAHDNVTREQIAAILYNYAAQEERDLSQKADLSAYTDSGTVSPWAREAVRWAAASDLIRGRSAGTLAPQEPATRAEVGAVLMRYIQNNAA